MQPIGVLERRRRLVRRHLLDPTARASSVLATAEALVALHATDSATVFLSVLARTEGLDPAAIERELYVERTVVRMLGMRRTLFVVPRPFRPVVQAACTDDIAARERKRLLAWLEGTAGLPDPPGWLSAAEHAALQAVAARGEAATAELVAVDPMLATRIDVGGGKWATTVSAGSRILPLLAAQGHLLRGRPRGTWISGQFRWVQAETWLGEAQETRTQAEARAVLVGGWLHAFGPGTETDLRWWTGLGAKPIREALAAVGAVTVQLDDAVGFALPDDLATTPAPEPAAAFLPTLDPTTMGWKERGWYLGEHAGVLFDSNGNAGPTVWWDGRVVGGWSQRADGEIVHRTLEDVGSDARTAIEAEAERLRAWLGDVRVSPGFLPPFQRELAR